MRNFIARVVTAVTGLLVAASAQAICTPVAPPGIGPLTNANYNNFFPVSVLGIQISPAGAKNPPLMVRSPVCLCPSHFGITLPGIMVTYWSPVYVYEAEDDPGCYPTISGATILPGFEGQRGAGATEDHTVSLKRQGHFYSYPLFAFMKMFESGVCQDQNQIVNLAYTTEVDPLWHSDLWTSVLNPEAVLFNNIIADLACIPDAIATNLGITLDPIFWCSGGKNVYPHAGGNERSDSNENLNMITMTKFLMRHHRVAALWQSIGPSAVCFTHPNPVMPKSQYRPDPIWPFPKGFGRNLVMGTHPLLWGTVANVPTQEGSVFLIWKAVQCCVRP